MGSCFPNKQSFKTYEISQFMCIWIIIVVTEILVYSEFLTTLIHY